MFKSNYFKLFMKLNKVKYGKELNLYGVPMIFRKGKSILKIGEGCTIKSSFLSNLVGLNHRTIIVTRTDEAKIEIGNNVGISGATIYARKGISIGDNTLIGGIVKIIIGCNALILKGTEIGDGSVVGAGSVVSGKFPKNVVIAGNPSKVVKNL